MEQLFEDFGSLVFNEKEMHERLPKPVYQAWKKTVANEGMLDRQTADAIAHAMKRWAIEKGATHYTHWFQPLTGSTAEKHDAFLDPDTNGEAMTRFSGKSLIKGEPDASSFPSGGLRATFEARGYTYWDVTSPVFIKDNVLCIPTVFVSYTGESLDKKDPLLKSLKTLSNAATKVVNLLGDKDVKSCTTAVGLEQEYFLIDRKFYDQRTDLKLTGRTLFGTSPAKGQDLTDHYFGAIPERVSQFMKDVDKELWKLGIYAKTEHNEVAPCQFELAPVYSTGNIAVDQNQLTMDVLKRTAEKHGLACLLHEKPFAGVNGSGKHNNWSIVTDDGQNLFTPGEKPAENIRFLVFICAFIRAVDENAALLRFSAGSTGNDYRLGADEAPPAIISIYLGDYIEQILYGLYLKHPALAGKKEQISEFNPISGLSYIPHDNADRNRTSPVAFTGNKFEFRMLGSSMSASMVNTILNTCMADSLDRIATELEGIKYLQDVRSKALDICREIIHNHKRILFSGDGYSSEWVKEAERRGLPNVKSYIESIDVLSDKRTIALLTKDNVYTERELSARKSIYTEQYIQSVGLEVRTLVEIVRKEILPSMSAEYAFYVSTMNHGGKNAPKYIQTRTKQLSTLIDHLYEMSEKLESDYQIIIQDGMHRETGIRVYEEICPLMEIVRKDIDAYEVIASERFYHIPVYEKMMFSF